MKRGSAAAVGGVAYFNPRTTNVVYAYDSFSQEWSELHPRCPHWSFSLVTCDGVLTAVGGSEQKDTPGNRLLSFSNGEWKEILPPMSRQRSSPGTIFIHHYLVVAGGCGELRPTVEIMDKSTFQWQTARSLPYQDGQALDSVTMAACGDSMYAFCEARAHDVIYSSCLTTLLRSSSQDGKEEDDVWNRISDSPMSQSTPITLHDQLIIVGGHDSRGELDTVHCYDATANSWKKLGSLICPKALPLVTKLTGEKVVVIHENYDRSFVGIAVVLLL